MTEYQLTHPLTDAKLHDEYGGYLEEGWCNSIYCPDDMRAVADWQLKQCLEFLRTHKFHERHDYFDLRADNYANLLEDAMRPTQENN